jgi:hypothetical protein
MGTSKMGFDLDSWGHVTRAAVFTLAILALISMVIVLGLVALYSWEAESLLHCSPWSTPSSPCGGFF